MALFSPSNGVWSMPDYVANARSDYSGLAADGKGSTISPRERGGSNDQD